MIRVLLDTCVVIDYMDRREGFFDDAFHCFELLAKSKFTAAITAKSLTDIFYFTHKRTHNNEAAREIIRKLIYLVPVVDTAASDCENALFSDMSDYEDAVMSETALRMGFDYIVTRNMKDYKKSKVPAILPGDLFRRIIDREA